jgi:hypothetical protein
MARNTSHGDLFGKLVAVLVFLGGIGVLGVVFYFAVHLFESPVPGLGLPVPPGGTPPSGATIGAALAGLLAKLAILAVLVLSGSLIASKGVHLYAHAVTAHHPLHPDTHGEPMVDDSPPPSTKDTKPETTQ